MTEAVIVSAARTPIGRASKGSLVECRPDELSATVARAALERAPGLDPAEVEDIVWGTAQPGGPQGWNLARLVGILAGLHDVPGVTVNRYCSSSVQAIRIAAHAVRAGEGDVFLCGGVESISQLNLLGWADGGLPTHN